MTQYVNSNTVLYNKDKENKDIKERLEEREYYENV